MGIIIDPRQLQLVELGPILEVDADGIVERVEIVGADFITTFFRIMRPFGFADAIRAPMLRVRRPIISYEPNQLNGLLAHEQAKLTAAGKIRLIQ